MRGFMLVATCAVLSLPVATLAACSAPSETERYAGVWRLLDGTVETVYAEKPDVVGAIGLASADATTLDAEFDGFSVTLPPARAGFGLVTPSERPIDEDHSRRLLQLDVVLDDEDVLHVDYEEEWKERYSAIPGEDGEILCCETQPKGVATYQRSGT